VRRRSVGQQDLKNLENVQETLGVQEKQSCERERGQAENAEAPSGLRRGQNEERVPENIF